MPALYTHALIANQVLQAYPTPLQEELRPFLPLYYFGAQGADFCFFYRFLTKDTPNLGSYLHRKGSYDSFSVFRLFSHRHTDIKAYALGYISHYAADTTFHPFVYSLSKKSPLQHNRIEYALDEYFKKKKVFYDFHPDYLRPPLDETERKNLFYAYLAVSAKCGLPALRFPSFSRAISLFNAYPPIPSAIFKNTDEAFLTLLLNHEKREWRSPFMPKQARFESVNELFENTIRENLFLSEQFLLSIEQNVALPYSLFSKNFLSGLPIKK